MWQFLPGVPYFPNNLEHLDTIFESLRLDLDLFNFCNTVTRIYPKDNSCLIKGYLLKYAEYEKIEQKITNLVFCELRIHLHLIVEIRLISTFHFPC